MGSNEKVCGKLLSKLWSPLWMWDIVQPTSPRPCLSITASSSPRLRLLSPMNIQVLCVFHHHLFKRIFWAYFMLGLVQMNEGQDFRALPAMDTGFNDCDPNMTQRFTSITSSNLSVTALERDFRETGFSKTTSDELVIQSAGLDSPATALLTTLFFLCGWLFDCLCVFYKNSLLPSRSTSLQRKSIRPRNKFSLRECLEKRRRKQCYPIWGIWPEGLWKSLWTHMYYKYVRRIFINRTT